MMDKERLEQFRNYARIGFATRPRELAELLAEIDEQSHTITTQADLIGRVRLLLGTPDGKSLVRHAEEIYDRLRAATQKEAEAEETLTVRADDPVLDSLGIAIDRTEEALHAVLGAKIDFGGEELEECFGHTDYALARLKMAVDALEIVADDDGAGGQGKAA